MPRVLLHIGAGVCLYLFVLLASADVITGQVVKVVDGDTIDILVVDKRVIRIRLAGIDAPERKQAFYRSSHAHLAELVAAKVVTVEWNKKDRFQRLIGKVLVDGRDACLAQVRAGWAWHYKQFAKEQTVEDRQAYAAAELEARRARIGLWADGQPTPPWSFRKRGNRREVEPRG